MVAHSQWYVAGFGCCSSTPLFAVLTLESVARIMKNALPDNAKIAKEAKECMQECVSEFISFITSEGKCLCVCALLLAVS